MLVGFDKADDAGVYLVAPNLALVHTVDFFTPIVDDPYTFGQIAATNSLSDVYAMGGRPINALAMVCFPASGDLDILERILAGGLSKMIEAGCTVIGGHSIRDEEIKFGYAVTGTVHPQRVLTNSGAQAGDRLLLTKALGTGVISTAIKKQKAEQAWIDAAVRSMTTLNKAAAEVVTRTDIDVSESSFAPLEQPDSTWRRREYAMYENEQQERRQRGILGLNDASDAPPMRTFAIHSVTDVTGFGLIGHSREMALGSGVSLRMNAARIPLLAGALECVRAGYVPGGLKANREFAECVLAYEDGVPEELRTMLFDPQTAGGLLIAVAAGDTNALTRALSEAGVPVAEIGEVLPSTKPLIQIVS